MSVKDRDGRLWLAAVGDVQTADEAHSTDMSERKVLAIAGYGCVEEEGKLWNEEMMSRDSFKYGDLVWRFMLTYQSTIRKYGLDELSNIGWLDELSNIGWLDALSNIEISARCTEQIRMARRTEYARL
ncbi:hypothetical protein L2E82_44581 [Cichorium intybus]|uniref:Uncharacterized protein n=1 Tax=Cichorium intybus TaxID=13427 RepID=A0ACB8ZRM4_CICIN|nr:hypothetical protein L2E82_44581 [Cichorium intybus]